jgi:hypothetical protein
METKLFLGILEWFIILTVLVNFMNAAGDGLRGKDLKSQYAGGYVTFLRIKLPITNGGMYHVYWALCILLLLLIPHYGIQVRWVDILGFALIRFSFFDIIYNIYAKNKPFEFGTTGIWDRMLKNSWFDGGFGTGVLLVLRLAMFMIGCMLIQDFFITNF